MKKIALCALGLFLVPFICSCNNSNDVNYNNNNPKVTEDNIESKTYKINYIFLEHAIAIYDEYGNLVPNEVSEIRYWADQDYDIDAFGDLAKSFYCLGDSIKVTYDKSKVDSNNVFPYEVTSVERIHTATVEVVSLDEIKRNENGGISFIGEKSTEYNEDNVKDSIYISNTSLKYGYLSSYTSDILYRATYSNMYVYYSFDPRV